jgi:hypothetical protein
MSAALNKLIATIWQPAHALKQPYTTGGTVETPPAVANNPDGTANYSNPWRFVRIQALDGDLLVKLGVGAQAAPGSGDILVLAGSAEIFQLADGGTVNVAASVGTANGAVIWGR